MPQLGSACWDLNGCGLVTVIKNKVDLVTFLISPGLHNNREVDPIIRLEVDLLTNVVN